MSYLSTTSEDNRWSEVVPPNAALTFAVVWDPEDGIVSFSGQADLLQGFDVHSSSSSPDSPTDAFEQSSQFLTINEYKLSSSRSEDTATPIFFKDYHDFLFEEQSSDHFKLGKPRISSTLDGLDIYLRGSMFPTTHLRSRRFSFLGGLADDFDFDPRTSFAIWMGKMVETQSDLTSDGTPGTSNDEEYNLRSAFSVTTTSTSNYVDVEWDHEYDDDEVSASWSTLEAPTTPSFSQMTFVDQQRRSPGRLKKRKPTNHDIPVSPSEVLQRPRYNHINSNTSPSPTTHLPKRKNIPGFIRNIGWK